MAPEQALSPRTTDQRADLWAVGAVLYYLIAGRAPFASDTDVATLTLLASGKPPDTLPPGAPDAIRATVKRALAWDPNGRFQTAAELRKELEAAMSDTGLSATSADVAAFCAQYLADRINARKTAISVALAEAEDLSRAALARLPGESSGRNVSRCPVLT